jgi:diguanylate cyclase (GGDEF)-like protein/PAS domain S-box-containing protein
VKSFILKQSTLVVIFFAFAVGLILLFVGIDRALYSDKVQKTALNNAVSKTLEREKYFKNFLADSDSILIGIANSTIFQSYLKGKSVDTNALFLLIAHSSSNIMQLRYIDKNGIERIRVDRNKVGDDVFIIKKEALQNKSNCYYFTDSLTKPLGKLWFSSVDLNVEHNSIERPYKPTLRAILPISDKNNHFNGIVIINYFMAPFLDSFFNAPLYDMILADEKGYPLVHYEKKKNWGFYQQPQINLKDEFPEGYSAIFSSKFYKDDSIVARKLDLNIDGGLYLILQLKNSYLQKEHHETLEEYFIIALIVIALSFIVSLFLSGMVQKMMEGRLKLLDKIETEHQRYKILLDVAVDGVHILDLEGNLLECSYSFAEMLGYSDDEIRTLNVTDWDVNFSKETVLEIINSLKEKSALIETKHRRKDGSIYDASMTAVKIHILDNDYIYLSVRDITKQKLQEEELTKLLKEQEAFLSLQTASLFRINNRKFDSVSDFFTIQLGYTREEILGQDSHILYKDEEKYRSNGQIIYNALSVGKPCEVEYIAKRKDGSLLNLLVGFTPIEGYPSEAIGVAVDISKQKMTELKLTKAFMENDHLLNIIDYYVSFTKVGMDGIIKNISTNFCKQLGCLKEDVVGKNCNILKSGGTANSLYQKIWEAVESEKELMYEIKNRNFENGTNWYRVSISPDYDEFNKLSGYIAFYENIDDQMMFKSNSETDKLTNLPNRGKIDDVLDKELLRANRYKQPFSVILIDIDHFKEVNDQFGHQTGDLILQEFARIVVKNIRITDFVGRWGGEEFLVICPNTNEKGAFSLAETLRKTIESNTFSLIQHKTASLGVAEYHEGSTLENLFKKADDALYAAKNTGRNRTSLSPASKTY